MVREGLHDKVTLKSISECQKRANHSKLRGRTFQVEKVSRLSDGNELGMCQEQKDVQPGSSSLSEKE